MKKSFLTILQYLFFLALGVFFVWLTLKDVKQEQWQTIQSSLARARHWLFIPVILMLFLSHYSRALRWKILMEPLGYTPTTFNTFSAVMIGYLVNAGVPRLGEVVKCTLLSKYEKISADKLVGTIVVERLVDLVCLIIIFVLAFLLQGHIFGEYILELFQNFFRDRSGGFSVTRLIIGILSFLGFLSLIYIIIKKYSHINIVRKIKQVIKGVGYGLGSIRLIKHKGLFIFHSILIWVLYLLSTTAGIYALQETDHLGLKGGLTSLAVGSVGMIVTPGGIGAYPWLIEKLMLLYHVPEAIGKALGWLLWSAQTIFIVVGGVIFSGLFSYYNKKRKPVENRS